MALSYVGGNSAVGTGATISVSLTALTGGSGSTAQAGDIVVVFWGWATSGGTDASLTMNSSGYSYAFADVWADDTREANMRAAYKIMGGTPDTTCVVNGPNNAANGGFAVVQVWRGVDPNTPLTGTASATSALNSNHGNPPAITPAVNNAAVICGMAGSGATSASGTKTAPTNYTTYNVAVRADGSSADCYGSISARLLSGGGGASEDPAAYSGGSTSTSDGWCAGTLALKPLVLQNVQITMAGGGLAGGSAALKFGKKPAASGGALAGQASRVFSASDDFNRGDGALGANWQPVVAGKTIVISSQRITPGVSEAGAWFLPAASFVGADQWAQVTVTAANYNGIGPAVRVSANGYYGLYYFNGVLQIFRGDNAGGWNLVAQRTMTVVANDVLRLEVSLSRLIAKVNGIAVIQGQDTNLTAGSPGICGYNDGVNPLSTADNWICGEILDYFDASVNGGFERTTADYTGEMFGLSASGSSTIARDTGDKHSGSASVKIVLDGAASYTFISGGYIRQLIVGHTYRYKIWARVTDATGSPRLRIEQSGQDVYLPFVDTAWTEFIGTLQTDYVGFTISNTIEAANYGKTFYVDDIELVDITNGYPSGQILVDNTNNGDFASGSGNAFNQWTTGQAGSSTVTQDATGGRAGSRCAKIYTDGSSSLAYLKRYWITFSGQTLRAQFWVKTDAPLGGNPKVRISMNGADVDIPITTNNWFFVDAEYLTDNHDFTLANTGGGLAGYNLWVDDVTLQVVQSLGAKYGRKESSSGGAVVGGTATVVGAHAGNSASITMAGGAVIGSTAGLKAGRKEQPTAGAIVGSTAAVKAGRKEQPTAGALSGGSATAKYGRKALLPTAGALVGGTATAKNGRKESGTAGTIAGGAAGLKAGLIKPTSAGALAGGSATIKGGRIQASSAGAIVGGTAALKAGEKIQPTAGAIAGGTASSSWQPASNNIQVQMAGGALAGGAALIIKRETKLVSGGAVSGGTATASWTPAHQSVQVTMQGGATAGGTFTVKRSNKIPGAGGAISGGGILVFWNPVITGTAQTKAGAPGEYAFDTRLPVRGREAQAAPVLDQRPRILPISGTSDTRGAGAEARAHGYYRPEVDLERPFPLGQAEIDQALKSRQGQAAIKPGHAYALAAGTVTDDEEDLLQALAAATLEEELNQ